MTSEGCLNTSTQWCWRLDSGLAWQLITFRPVSARARLPPATRGPVASTSFDPTRGLKKYGGPTQAELGRKQFTVTWSSALSLRRSPVARPGSLCGPIDITTRPFEFERRVMGTVLRVSEWLPVVATRTFGPSASLASASSATAWATRPSAPAASTAATALPSPPGIDESPRVRPAMATSDEYRACGG